MNSQDDALQFKPLAETLWRGAFCCGISEIDSWFTKRAWDQHSKFRSRVTTVHNAADELVGFYAFCITLKDDRMLEKTNNLRNRAINRHFPTLEIDYIAVDRPFQGQGIGTVITGRIVDIFIQAADQLGVPVMTLEAINERAAKLYRRMGFEHYGPHPSLRMMLPAQAALALSRENQTENNAC
ncbi:MAG TPA: GNAT family N-acetyltransferase [Rhodopila sp.]|nr:GNAT family N-acetyltransferase [Rhodopila sp.]